MEIRDLRKIKTALVSLYHKAPARELIECLNGFGVDIYSTGGTYDYIASLGIPVKTVESVTSYPSILGGRVKTLHPLIFGGLLARRELDADLADARQYDIPMFDMVVVDLYPFEDAVQQQLDEEEVIEKIDIGGISLIRAAAKNYQHVAVAPDAGIFGEVTNMVKSGQGALSLADRKNLAKRAFDISSHYDAAIYHYFSGETPASLKISLQNSSPLRYGENPHQQAVFFGDLGHSFTQLNGKELSYNNLLDVDAAIALISEVGGSSFAVIKHTNVCGFAERASSLQAWEHALAGDPVSAFGGVIVTNQPVDILVAAEVDKLFYEVFIAPSFDEDALGLLRSRKNRIILQSRKPESPKYRLRSALHGVLWQSDDKGTEAVDAWKLVTDRAASAAQLTDLELANKIVKHVKSNAIVLVKDKQLVGVGCGQTSRVDALEHAIAKANTFGLSLRGAVMASDAFFPFPDCVEIACNAGIQAVVQPGGSVRDQESIDFCNAHNMAMLLTGRRHFKH